MVHKLLGDVKVLGVWPSVIVMSRSLPEVVCVEYLVDVIACFLAHLAVPPPLSVEVRPPHPGA
eukprot:1781122-Pyramimonas_sp.AAC.1